MEEAKSHTQDEIPRPIEVDEGLTRCYVSKITFNNDESIDIAQNDIVIFVGPNNAGKSQSLKDIYALMKANVPTVVIKSIEITKKKPEKLQCLLEQISQVTSQEGYKSYSGLGFNTNSYIFNNFSTNETLNDIRNIFVSFLDTRDRLTICDPPAAITNEQPMAHPIHYTASNYAYEQLISNSFKKAFGKYLIVQHTGPTAPLRIGDLINLNGQNFENERQRHYRYEEILNTYPQVQNQGDGIKSFTGILLRLIIKNYCTFLIDEPESFLHPPQAKIMGNVIGELLNNKQQAFISTHSQDIIKGLLEICPERIKIVRITREENTNHFSILDNEHFKSIWNDPLLKHSEIMNSLFHQSVVLCESDSDCRLYSIILSHIKEKAGAFSETLFIHCGGKHRMPKIIKALKVLNVKLLIVPDLDVLSKDDDIKKIIESCGADWTPYKKDYKILSSNLETPKGKIVRAEAKTRINAIIDKNEDENLTKNEIDKITNTLKIDTKWGIIKKGGFRNIPAGEASAAFENLNSKFKKLGIHMVLVGELENFIKTVGNHGPGWANTVLEKYPNLDDKTYEEVTNFVKEWKI